MTSQGCRGGVGRILLAILLLASTACGHPIDGDTAKLPSTDPHPRPCPPCERLHELKLNRPLKGVDSQCAPGYIVPSRATGKRPGYEPFTPSLQSVGDLVRAFDNNPPADIPCHALTWERQYSAAIMCGRPLVHLEAFCPMILTKLDASEGRIGHAHLSHCVYSVSFDANTGLLVPKSQLPTYPCEKTRYRTTQMLGGL